MPGVLLNHHGGHGMMRSGYGEKRSNSIRNCCALVIVVCCKFFAGMQTRIRHVQVVDVISTANRKTVSQQSGEYAAKDLGLVYSQFLKRILDLTCWKSPKNIKELHCGSHCAWPFWATEDRACHRSRNIRIKHKLSLFQFQPTTNLPQAWLFTNLMNSNGFSGNVTCNLRSNLAVCRVESNLRPLILSAMPVVTWLLQEVGSHGIWDQMCTKFSLTCVVHCISLNCTLLFGMRQKSCPIGLSMNRKQFKRTGILSRIPKRFPEYTQEQGSSSVPIYTSPSLGYIREHGS